MKTQIEKKLFLLAERNRNKEYSSTEFNESLENLVENLEYGDVLEGEYQIWEYPSGRIFSIHVDRELEDSLYYSLPSKNTWLPVLKENELDKKKVENAFIDLSKKEK